VDAKQSDWVVGPDVPFELLVGVHIRLEDGEEDTTVRPTRYPVNADGPATPDQTGHVKEVTHESPIKAGPELTDWLSRTDDL